jgi:hypothetical protein
MDNKNSLMIIINDLDTYSKIDPKALMRECINKRLINCSKVYNDEIDEQINTLLREFNNLSLSSMSRVIKKLSKSLNKRQMCYIKQLILYRDSLKNKD